MTTPIRQIQARKFIPGHIYKSGQGGLEDVTHEHLPNVRVSYTPSEPKIKYESDGAVSYVQHLHDQRLQIFRNASGETIITITTVIPEKPDFLNDTYDILELSDKNKVTFSKTPCKNLILSGLEVKVPSRTNPAFYVRDILLNSGFIRNENKDLISNKIGIMDVAFSNKTL